MRATETELRKYKLPDADEHGYELPRTIAETTERHCFSEVSAAVHPPVSAFIRVRQLQFAVSS
jgi:hypothetical protein